MKKIINLLFISALIIFSGCSSSDDSNNPQQLSTENSFSVTIDGTLYTFDTFFATKTFDNYEVLGFNGNNENFFIRFNKNGVLDRANFYILDGTLDNNFNSAFYNPDFSLSNLAIDLSQNVVSANFSGNVYEDDLDVVTSEVRAVQSGSFNLVFVENQLDPLLNEFTDATINGSLFESVKHGSSGGFGGNTVYELFGISDGTLTVSVVVDANALQEGTYNFTTGSSVNRINVEYVNPFDETNDYEELSVSGILVIDAVIEGTSFDIIQGSFSATATGEGGEVYTIENGTFNLSM